MTATKHQPRKINPFVRVTGIVLLSVFVIIGLISAVITFEKHQTKQEVMAVANELKLPENFVLTGTSYSDHSCLDVSANVTLYYKSKDGQPLDRKLVVDELMKIGYKRQTYDLDSLSKSFKEVTMTVKQLNAPPENLSLNFSR